MFKHNLKAAADKLKKSAKDLTTKIVQGHKKSAISNPDVGAQMTIDTKSQDAKSEQPQKRPRIRKSERINKGKSF